MKALAVPSRSIGLRPTRDDVVQDRCLLDGARLSGNRRTPLLGEGIVRAIVPELAELLTLSGELLAELLHLLCSILLGLPCLLGVGFSLGA